MGIITVSQLNRYMASKVSGDAHLRSFLIRGEISNFTAAASGHCYFSLKDEGGVIKAVMFRRMAGLLKFRPENGMRVIVSAGLTVYEAGGIYQLNVTDMQPDGVGAAALALEQRRQKLRAAGLFDESAKQPLPALPRTVGVITSGTGAALQDILNILRRRCPIVRVKVFPVLVQGEQAPAALTNAIRFAGGQGCDVLILGRGGGASEDLDAFNAEQVAYAIAECPVPLISAVGHETDVTIADAVADRRAPTPSAAAELAVPELSALDERIFAAARSLRTAYETRLGQEQRRIERMQARLGQYRPDHRIRTRQSELTALTERLEQAMMRRLDRENTRLGWMRAALPKEMRSYLGAQANRLHTVQEKLTALDPLVILQRGYAAVYHENGDILPSVKTAAAGESIRIRLQDGSLTARVEEIHAL